MNILIAEDAPFLQLLNKELMNVWGFDFDMASDGLEAVDYAQRNEGKYDLCLMDVEMPGMNGIEATRIIRRTVKYFPILAFTSNPNYKKSCLDVGMDDFSVKPCPHSELFDKINELTVKAIKCVLQGNNIMTKEEIPVDKNHAQELKELKKQGLVKMRLDGPENREVIAHKHVPNKISHDFNIKKYSMTEFLNRDPERPTLCDLYRGNKNCIVETFVDVDDYINKSKIEDENLDKYTEKSFKVDDE